MKTQNYLLTIISMLLTVIILQNAGIIPQLKAHDVNINRIKGESFTNRSGGFKSFNPVALPVY